MNNRYLSTSCRVIIFLLVPRNITHRDKSFSVSCEMRPNYLIVVTLSRLIMRQMEFCLVPNQLGKCNYQVLAILNADRSMKAESCVRRHRHKNSKEV